MGREGDGFSKEDTLRSTPPKRACTIFYELDWLDKTKGENGESFQEILRAWRNRNVVAEGKKFKNDPPPPPDDLVSIKAIVKMWRDRLKPSNDSDSDEENGDANKEKETFEGIVSRWRKRHEMRLPGAADAHEIVETINKNTDDKCDVKGIAMRWRNRHIGRRYGETVDDMDSSSFEKLQFNDILNRWRNRYMQSRDRELVGQRNSSLRAVVASYVPEMERERRERRKEKKREKKGLEKRKEKAMKEREKKLNRKEHEHGKKNHKKRDKTRHKEIDDNSTIPTDEEDERDWDLGEVTLKKIGQHRSVKKDRHLESSDSGSSISYSDAYKAEADDKWKESHNDDFRHWLVFVNILK